MSFTRSQIVEAARVYRGAPWLHQGRTARGIDCVGLIVCTGHAVGYSTFDLRNYSRIPDGQMLEAALSDNLDKLSDWRDALPGDVLVMKWGAAPQHCLIVTERRDDNLWAIHAVTDDCVKEHRLDAPLLRRIHSGYRFRGVID